MRIDGRTLSHEMSETIRRLAVHRVKEGVAPSEVITSYGLCRTTIYKWLTAERRGGTAALKARKHPGRKPALAPRQKLQVRRWINGKDPRQYGFDFGLWTRQIVAALIAQKCGVRTSATRWPSNGGQRASSRACGPAPRGTAPRFSSSMRRACAPTKCWGGRGGCAGKRRKSPR